MQVMWIHFGKNVYYHTLGRGIPVALLLLSVIAKKIVCILAKTTMTKLHRFLRYLQEVAESLQLFPSPSPPSPMEQCPPRGVGAQRGRFFFCLNESYLLYIAFVEMATRKDFLHYFRCQIETNASRRRGQPHHDNQLQHNIFL